MVATIATKMAAATRQSKTLTRRAREAMTLAVETKVTTLVAKVATSKTTK